MADRSTPLYRVWRPEMDETEECDGKWYGALDVQRAAEIWSRYIHPSIGFEWTWPIVVRVRDPDGKLWDVMVERHAVPEFIAETPRPVS